MKYTLLFITVIFCGIVSRAQCLSSGEEFMKYFRDNAGALDPVEGVWTTQYDTTRFTPDSIKSAQRFYIIRHKKYFILCRPQQNDLPAGPRETLKKQKKANTYLYSKTTVTKFANAPSKTNSFTAEASLINGQRLYVFQEFTTGGTNSPVKYHAEKITYVKLPVY